MPHLDVADLTVAFKVGGNQDMKALDAVSFSLARGGTLGIVGESGSGKSTLARALLGYTRPGARVVGGKVRVGDTDVFALDAPELRAFRGARAAMVPQNPLSSLTPHMTIGEQLDRAGHHSRRQDKPGREGQGARPDGGDRPAVSGPARRALSPRAFRRPASARGDRISARGRSRAHHPGRADHGAGQDRGNARAGPGHRDPASPTRPSSMSAMT